MAKNAAIAGGLRRARVAASARSGNFRRSRPMSGTTAKAFIRVTPLLDSIISKIVLSVSRYIFPVLCEMRATLRPLKTWHRWATRKILHECVADIAQIFDPDFAGEITIGGKFPQKRKEFDALPQAGILLRILAEGDEVQNFFLLRRCAIQIGFAVAIDAGIVEPQDSA